MTPTSYHRKESEERERTIKRKEKEVREGGWKESSKLLWKWELKN